MRQRLTKLNGLFGCAAQSPTVLFDFGGDQSGDDVFNLRGRFRANHWDAVKQKDGGAFEAEIPGFFRVRGDAVFHGLTLRILLALNVAIKM